MPKNRFYILLSLIGASFSSSAQYSNYCNSRFVFCMNYPASFTMKNQSENNDGAIFTSKDRKTTIWTYGRLAVEELDTLKQEFGFATDKIKIAYQVIKSNWFVFSGLDSAGNTIYQKTVKKAVEYYGDPNTEVFQTIRISYPADQQDRYKEYCSMVAKSL